MTESIALWFEQTLGAVMPGELVVFIVSMIPILELRGGLIVAGLMQIPIWLAIPICIIGNVIPVILILLFIKPLFRLLKKVPGIRKVIIKLESKGSGKNAKKIAAAEFLGLLLFVGIPLPGTGGWTGSLIAALLNVRFGKALLAIFCGLCLATAIMSFISYGIPWLISTSEESGWFVITVVLVSIAAAALLAFIIVKCVRSSRKFKQTIAAPEERYEAVVLEKTTSEKPRRMISSENPTSFDTEIVTKYMVAFRLETEEIKILAVPDDVFPLISEGDKGTLSFQKDQFLKFERI